MNRYNSYKDSGVEWIGEIPSHWEKKKLKHIVDYVNGIDTWDETLGHSVKTMRQEDWSNQTFGTYDHAWHHVERLNEKYKELANKDE